MFVRNVYFPVFIMIMLMCGVACERKWTGEIEGQVTEIIQDTPVPVANVLMTAASEKNEYAVSDVSDLEGRYRLTDVRWGPNSVKAYHPLYDSATKFADVIRDETVSLDFELAKQREYITPEVFVQVTDPSGNPLPQVRLDLYRKESSDYFVYLETKSTAESGSIYFTLPTLYKDQIVFYQFRVSVFGYESQKADFVAAWFDPEPSIVIVLDPV